MNMPTESLALLGWGGLAALGFFLVLWVIQAIRRDAGIVDVDWSAGVGLMGLFLAAAAAVMASRGPRAFAEPSLTSVA